MLDNLSDEQLKDLQADMVERIRQASGRIHYADGRRGSFSALALGFIAAGVALLASLLANASHIGFRPGLWALVATGIGAIGTGIVVLLQFAAQTNFNYPFKTSAPTWKWFYRDALPEVKTVHTPWHTRLSKSSRTAAEAAFTKAWPAFAKREEQLADRRTSAEQDLNQLFVLYANDFYKNRFLTQLRTVFSLGVVVTTVVSAVVLVITWWSGS